MQVSLNDMSKLNHEKSKPLHFDLFFCLFGITCTDESFIIRQGMSIKNEIGSIMISCLVKINHN